MSDMNIYFKLVSVQFLSFDLVPSCISNNKFQLFWQSVIILDHSKISLKFGVLKIWPL